MLKDTAEKYVQTLRNLMPKGQAAFNELKRHFDKEPFESKLCAAIQARGVARLCAAYIDEPERIKPFFNTAVLTPRHIYCLLDLLEHLVSSAQTIDSDLGAKTFPAPVHAMLFQVALAQCEMTQDLKFGFSRKP